MSELEELIKQYPDIKISARCEKADSLVILFRKDYKAKISFDGELYEVDIACYDYNDKFIRWQFLNQMNKEQIRMFLGCII